MNKIISDARKNFPHILIGYKSEWGQMYSNNKQEFLSLRYYGAQENEG